MSGPFSPGDTVSGRYSVSNYLSEGGMQYVYVVKDFKTNRLAALKTPKNPSAEKRFHRSAVVAAQVNHPNVAKTYDYVEKDGVFMLVEELVPGQDMKDAFLGMSEYIDPYLAAKTFHHLSKGIAAAHHAGVVHRDLKPSNVMVEGGYSATQLKITDFGIAKMAAAELEEAAEGGEETLSASATAVGALPYMAPEAIESSSSAGLPSDIWSLGAMMYQLLCGKYPFGAGLKAVPKILAAKPPEVPFFVTSKQQFKPLSGEIIDIIFSCLQKEPEKRPTADQLVQMCSNLCYTNAERSVGTVYDYRHNAFGFVEGPNGSVFYHKASVYGQLPKVGDQVMFSCYSGGQAPRALPLVRLSASADKS